MTLKTSQTKTSSDFINEPLLFYNKIPKNELLPGQRKAIQVLEFTKKRIEEINKIVHASDVETRKLMRNNFFAYLVICHPELLKVPFAPFHMSMFKDLEKLTMGDLDELVWIMFRGSAKSSLILRYIEWCVIGRRVRFIVFGSWRNESAENATNEIRGNLYSNKQIQYYFGDLFSVKKKSNLNTKRGEKEHKDDFIVNGCRVLATTTQKTIRGFRHGNDRVGLLILDDIEVTELLRRPSDVSAIKKWIGEARHALEADGKLVVLGNLISTKHNIAEIMERAMMSKSAGRVRVVNAIDKNGELSWYANWCDTDEERTKWKEKGIPKISKETKMRNNLEWMTEFMNAPGGLVGGTFTEEMFKGKMLSPTDVKNKAKSIDAGGWGSYYHFLLIDPAYTNNKRSDKVGFCSAWFFPEMNKTIIKSAFGAKFDSNHLLESIYTIHSSDPIYMMIWEKNTGNVFVEHYLKSEVKNGRPMIPLEWVAHGQTDKVTRINYAKYLFGTAENAYMDGEVYFDVQGCEELIEQLIKFPYCIDHNDDVIDAFAYLPAIEKYKKKIGGKRIELDEYELNPFGEVDVDLGVL